MLNTDYHKLWRKERRNKGLCIACGEATGNSGGSCDSCLKKKAAKLRELRKTRKTQGKCNNAICRFLLARGIVKFITRNVLNITISYMKKGETPVYVKLAEKYKQSRIQAAIVATAVIVI